MGRSVGDVGPFLLHVLKVPVAMSEVGVVIGGFPTSEDCAAVYHP